MHRVAVLVLPQFQIMTLAAVSAFEMANLRVPTPYYGVEVFSAFGGPVSTSIGTMVDTKTLGKVDVDTILVAGGPHLHEPHANLLAFLRTAATQGCRIASICTGAFVLAEAGLLKGKRVTTHWNFVAELGRRYPDLTIEGDRIFIVDENIWSSAGMIAGVDLVMGMVEKDLGLQVAKEVARSLVVHHRRTGGQSQHSKLLELTGRHDRVQEAIAYSRRNLGMALSVESLAHHVHLSARQFTRLFRSETGMSPAKAIESLRVETANMMMSHGRHSIDSIAKAVGFGNRHRMRSAFQRVLGIAPQDAQRTARAAR